MAAFLLLYLPIQWLFALIVACVIHETGHFVAIWILSGVKPSVHITAKGAFMHAPALTDGQELIAALAGPAFGMLTLIFGKWIPRTAFCAFFHSMYNLLPLYPMDGGRAACSMMTLLFSERTANTLCELLRWSCLSLIIATGFYGTFVVNLGILPVMLSITVFYRATKNTLQRSEREGTIVLP